MDPVTGMMIGSAAGSLFGGLMGNKSTEKTNAMNQAIAREQMAFQERMSNTAHTREVADLQQAGLNPILSATGGSGASAPSGASSTAVAPDKTFIGDALKDSMNTGLTAATTKAQVANVNADTLNKLETAKVINADYTGKNISNARSQRTLEADVSTATSEASKRHLEAARAKHEVERSSIAAKAERADLPRSIKESQVREDYTKFDKSVDSIQRVIDAGTSALNVHKYFGRPQSIRPGTPAETRALRRAGSKGIPVR